MNDDRKKRAAEAALDEVMDGQVVGIGTGSTAEAFVRLLAEQVKDGLLIEGVATSERTATLCRELAIPLIELERSPILDVTIDGADELDGGLTLIKGGGGALLREKIVAAASKRFVIIADDSKRVDTLGAFPLPIEINVFGAEPTRLAVAEIARAHDCEGELTLRPDADGGPFVTDGGHYILDIAFGRIADASKLSSDLLEVPGVVQHGLFIGLADVAYVASADGVERLEPAKS